MHFYFLFQEGRRDLASRLEEAVVNNSPEDIIAAAFEGGDVDGTTQAGKSPTLITRLPSRRPSKIIVYLLSRLSYRPVQKMTSVCYEETLTSILLQLEVTMGYWRSW